MKVKSQLTATMPCSLCKHQNRVHKKITSTIYFCEECKEVESNASFTPGTGEPIENDAPPIESTSTNDLLWEVRKNRGSSELQTSQSA